MNAKSSLPFWLKLSGFVPQFWIHVDVDGVEENHGIFVNFETWKRKNTLILWADTLKRYNKLSTKTSWEPYWANSSVK